MPVVGAPRAGLGGRIRRRRERREPRPALVHVARRRAHGGRARARHLADRGHRPRRPRDQEGRRGAPRRRRSPPRPRPPRPPLPLRPPRRRPPRQRAVQAPTGATPAAPRAPARRRRGTEPMSTIRKVIARNLRASIDNAVHVSTFFEVDMTRCWAVRAAVNKDLTKTYGVKASFLPFIMRADGRGDPALAVGQRRAARRQDHRQAPRQPRRRRLGQRRQGPRRAGHPQRRGAQPARPHARADRPRRARPHEAADGRRDGGRHVHAHEPRRLRHAARHADHPAAAGRDPRRRTRSSSGPWSSPTSSAATRSRSGR